MSTLAIVEEILREVANPMSVREIVERAGETLPTKSKTPDTVVARDLSMDIKKKGDASIFMRTSPGRYVVKEAFVKVGGTISPTHPATQPMTQPMATSVVENAMQNERIGVRGTGSSNDPSDSSSMPA